MFATLQKKKAGLSKLKIKYSELTTRHTEFDGNELIFENKRLLAVNAQLMKNIEEDKRSENYQKSPMSYLNAADSHALKPHTNLPLQGGLAGLEKK